MYRCLGALGLVLSIVTACGGDGESSKERDAAACSTLNDSLAVWHEIGGDGYTAAEEEQLAGSFDDARSQAEEANDAGIGEGVSSVLDAIESGVVRGDFGTAPDQVKLLQMMIACRDAGVDIEGLRP